MTIPTATLSPCPVCGARPSLFTRLMNTLGLSKPAPFTPTADDEDWMHDQFAEHRNIDEQLEERRGQLRDRQFF